MSGLDGSGEGQPTPKNEKTKPLPKPGWSLGENRLRAFLDGLRGKTTDVPQYQTPIEPKLPTETPAPTPNSRFK